MDERSTDLLMNTLKSARLDELSPRREDYIPAGADGFCAYMDQLIADRKLKRQDIFPKADLPQKYGYKLLTGESHTTSRDKLMRLFIAMGLSLKETQRALTLYGMPVLYPRLHRDAVLIIALNRGVDSVDTVCDWLSQQNEPPLEGSAD